MNAMKNNVRIRILSRQRKNGESDEMEICTEGTFLCKKGVYYLFYTEYTEIGEVSVRITADDTCVKVHRNGACRSTVEYRPGVPCEYAYQLPYGELIMTADTKEISCGLSKEGGSLRLSYFLDIHHEIFENELTIEVTGKDEENEDA